MSPNGSHSATTAIHGPDTPSQIVPIPSVQSKSYSTKPQTMTTAADVVHLPTSRSVPMVKEKEGQFPTNAIQQTYGNHAHHRDVLERHVRNWRARENHTHESHALTSGGVVFWHLLNMPQIVTHIDNESFLQNASLSPPFPPPAMLSQLRD
jgi:hypothetical protein